MFENNEYFRYHKYRNPTDYVVKAYVAPKLRIMEDNGCFKKSVKILDVGSGNGTFSYYFSEYTDYVICMDYSKQLLMANSSNLKILADGYKMPFNDNQFDVVFEANLLHHLDRPFCVIEEMKRCSKEYLVFIEPNRYNPLMFLLSLVVKAESGVRASYISRWRSVLNRLDIEIIAKEITGMISQQNTPPFMVPFLKIFDIDFCLGEYIVLICRKKN